MPRTHSSLASHAQASTGQQPDYTSSLSLKVKVLDFVQDMVGGIGVEPMTSAMSTQRSNQLS